MSLKQRFLDGKPCLTDDGKTVYLKDCVVGQRVVLVAKRSRLVYTVTAEDLQYVSRGPWGK